MAYTSHLVILMIQIIRRVDLEIEMVELNVNSLNNLESRIIIYYLYILLMIVKSTGIALLLFQLLLNYT